SPSAIVSPTPSPSSVKVEIRNGTTISGLAQKTKQQLEAKGFTVIAIGNAANRNVDKTGVYALNLTQADSASQLSALLNATSDTGLPKGEAKSSADILVILGKNAAP